MFNSRWKEFSGTEHAEEERRWLNAYQITATELEKEEMTSNTALNKTK